MTVNLSKATTLLDCGHAPSEHSRITTGYGLDRDGRTHCYDCITRDEHAEMQTAARHVAYISSDHKRVTNWPGRTLGTVTSYHEAGTRWTNHGKVSRRYIRVTDVHGATWRGSGPVESGNYVTLHRA